MAEHIARFEVLEKIGEGGMGAVYKARDPAISRVVAIKLLREGFDSVELRERFMQEARSAGGLQNTNIVTIFELGEYGGAPFIVMEFVVGEPLDRQIKRRAPLPLIRKLELMEALCSGLSYAHRAGIIHRDIKPANLMVNTDGVLKILDFGIARVGDSGLTKTGALIGTPNYMPPEQLHGDPVDRRADIFAVGAVFYELLSYQRAFPGNFTEAITRILHREPDPLAPLCGGLDPQIEAIVARALDKNPNHRYQDLGEMRRDIARIRQRLARDAPESLGGTLFAATAIYSPAPGSGEPTVRPTADESTMARASAEVEAAERQFEQGETAEAIRRLESFEPRNDIVVEALASLRDRVDELDRESQRRAAIGRAVEASSDAFGRGDYESAIRAADEALLIDERHAPARDLRRRSRAAIEEQRRLAELERRASVAIDEARQLFDAGDRVAGLERLSAFQPAHAVVSEVLSELRAEAAAIARREAEEQAREAEAARQAREEAERQAREAEAARQAREAELARQAREEAERQAREAELARQAREEAERQAREAELARQVREEAERQAREAQAARQAREAETARQAREAELARQAREDAERQAREAEAARQARAAELARQAREAESSRQARAVEALPAASAAAERPQASVVVPARRLTPMAAVAAGVVVVGVLGFGAYRTLRPSTPEVVSPARNAQPASQQPAPATSAAAKSDAAPASPPQPTQPLAEATTVPVTIDAEPWADVQITPARAAAGVAEQRGTTPMRVSLAPGEYSIRFSNPSAPRAVVRTITVAAGKDNSIRLAMPGLDADRILQEILPR